jgi:hypothetical protein
VSNTLCFALLGTQAELTPLHCTLYTSRTILYCASQVTAWWGQQNTAAAASTADTGAATSAPHKQTHSISAGRLSRLRLQAALPPIAVQLSSASAAVLCTLLASHSEEQAPPAPPPPWLQRSRSWTEHSTSAVDSGGGSSGSRHNSVSSPRMLLLRTLDSAAPDFTKEVLDELVGDSKPTISSSSSAGVQTAAAEQQQQQQSQQHGGALVELQLSAASLSLRLSASSTSIAASATAATAGTTAGGSSSEAALISVTLTDVQCDCSSAVVPAADNSTTASRDATVSVALGAVTVLDLQPWCAAGTAGYPLQRLLYTVSDAATGGADTNCKQVTQLSWCTNGVVDVSIPYMSINWNPNTVAAVMMFRHSLSSVQSNETAGATAQPPLLIKQHSSPTKTAAVVNGAVPSNKVVLRVRIAHGQISLNKDHLCRQLLVASLSSTTIEGSRQPQAGACMEWSGSLQSLRLRDASTAATHWRDLLGPHSAATDSTTTTTFSLARDAERPQGLLLQLHLGQCRFVYLQQTVMEWFDYVMTAVLGSAVWSPWLLVLNSNTTSSSSSSSHSSNNSSSGTSSDTVQLLAQQEAEAVATATHFSITADATQLLLPAAWQSHEHALITGSALTVQAAPARAAMGAAACAELVSQWTVQLADMSIATCHSTSTAASAAAASCDTEAQQLSLQLCRLLQQQQQQQQEAVAPLALELQARWVSLQHRRQPDDAVYEVCVFVGSRPAITLMQPAVVLLSAVLAGNLQSEPAAMVVVTSSSSNASTASANSSTVSSGAEKRIEYGCDREAAEATSFVLKVELKNVQCTMAPETAELQVHPRIFSHILYTDIAVQCST